MLVWQPHRFRLLLDTLDEQPVASINVFRREGDYWSVIFDGDTVHVRDLMGMRHLARLLADPGREYP